MSKGLRGGVSSKGSLESQAEMHSPDLTHIVPGVDSGARQHPD